jgi:putative SOS response-associated peptidase YedK
MITTQANSLLEKIHNTKKRMPVILPREKEKLWLRPDLDKDTIQSMLVPYDTNEMEGYPVSKLVHQIGFNTTNPEVSEIQDYPDLPKY